MVVFVVFVGKQRCVVARSAEGLKSREGSTMSAIYFPVRGPQLFLSGQLFVPVRLPPSLLNLKHRGGAADHNGRSGSAICNPKTGSTV